MGNTLYDSHTEEQKKPNPFIIRFDKDHGRWDFRSLRAAKQVSKVAGEGKIDHYLKVAIEYLVRGFSVHEVVQTVFGVSNSHLTQEPYFALIEYLCRDVDFLNRKFTRLDEMELKELWSEKQAVAALLKIVNDPHEKATPKLNAARELNLLYNFTMLDDKGNTRKTDWNDFYK